ncbi:peptidase S8/S53 domain-containing protein, partial [Kockovaella imperatae]
MIAAVAYLIVAGLSVTVAPIANAAPVKAEVELRFGEFAQLHKISDRHIASFEKQAIHPAEISTYAIKLHAQNQSAIDEAILQRSDPAHELYGQWLSLEDAHALTQSDPNGVKEVLEYLNMHGVASEAVTRSYGDRHMSFKATKAQADAIFGADFAVYNVDGHARRGTSAIKIPKSLHKYVFTSVPGVGFGFSHTRKQGSKRKLDNEEAAHVKDLHKTMMEDLAAQPPSHNNDPIAIQGQPVGVSMTGSLSQCWNYFLPACVRAQYHLPAVTSPTTGTSIGTLNLQPNCAANSDLLSAWEQLFPNVYNSNASYIPPYVLVPIDGVDPTGCSSSDTGEPDLDLQTVVPLTYPMKVIDFEAPDASDESLYGAVSAMGSNGIPKVDVLSVSYGGDESFYVNYFESNDTAAQYLVAQCQTTDAIVASGTTLLASSGDSGAQNIEFPALCPYWVAVGATDLNINAGVTAPSYAEQENDGWGYSGSGGFSTLGPPFNAAPSWQQSAVASYSTHYKDYLYKSLQNAAATPDVSAMGRNYIIVTGGDVYQYGGTSLSSPMFASLLAMINSHRVQNGVGLLGFPLPAFYANPTLFRD